MVKCAERFVRNEVWLEYGRLLSHHTSFPIHHLGRIASVQTIVSTFGSQFCVHK
jgi:hypothetical protein